MVWALKTQRTPPMMDIFNKDKHSNPSQTGPSDMNNLIGDNLTETTTEICTDISGKTMFITK